MRILLIGLCMFLFSGFASAKNTDSFTIAGCECYPQTVILGWRGTEPGTTLKVWRNSIPVYQGTNPTNPPNVYLYNQPLGDQEYKACTGIITALGFTPKACSNTLEITVT